MPTSIALAAVTINEIAWMGTTHSANDEWIELYNSGNSTSLDGWTLSDGMGLQVDLSGTLSANSYAVLERTDDDSAPGTAFLLYTGALSNSGATLTLRRNNGDIEDQVAGGENWDQVGGDNSTKETAQYTPSGWVTGSPTPGRSNVVAGDTTEPELINTKTESETHEASDNNTHISLTRPDNSLELAITGPSQGYVNQELNFFVKPGGLGERIMDSLNYDWNFGNLKTGRGSEVSIRYPYAGEYVIVVEGVYADYEAVTRHTITVLPTALSLERNRDGDLLLHNNASYEVDLSGYRLRGSAVHVFPPYSLLAPRATLTIAGETNTAHFMTALYDSAGELVASVLPDSVSYIPNQQVAVHEPPVTVRASTAQNTPHPVGLIAATSTMRAVAARPVEAFASTGLAAVAHASNRETNSTAGIPNEKLPYLGLMVIIIAGIAALYTRAPKEERDIEREQPFGLK